MNSSQENQSETRPDLPPARPAAPRPTTQMAIGCLIIPLIVAAIGFGVFTYVRAHAISRLTVPEGEMVLVRAIPDSTAPLLARFGEGRTLRITGRTGDWRWLEVELWANQQGWTLRPLDILVWQLEAPEKIPTTTRLGSSSGDPPGCRDDRNPGDNLYHGQSSRPG